MRFIKDEPDAGSLGLSEVVAAQQWARFHAGTLLWALSLPALAWLLSPS